MAISSKHQNIKNVVGTLLAQQGEVANRDIARTVGLTPQAVHVHLKRLVEEGELEVVGAGRSTRYRRPATVSRVYKTADIEEYVVWHELVAQLDNSVSMSNEARSILRYGFTKMLNNAIDHSQSAEVLCSLDVRGDQVRFEIRDKGVGAFEHVRDRLGLGTINDALLEISKGKTTTAPAQHTGEGIFFTSKALDDFNLESNTLRWSVDNELDDQAFGATTVDVGTRVTGSLSVNTSRRLSDVFDQYVIDNDFARSRLVVKLAQRSGEFVSRSEAKRLASGMERFVEVLVDFNGIDLVGQGFADELFRVWSSSHPETRFVPISMNDPVEAVVARAIRSRSFSEETPSASSQGIESSD